MEFFAWDIQYIYSFSYEIPYNLWFLVGLCHSQASYALATVYDSLKGLFPMMNILQFIQV